MDTINNKLQELYKQQFKAEKECVLQQLRSKRRSEEKMEQPAYPLLIKVDEEALSKADIKIMTFGQETDSWEHKVTESVIPIEESEILIDKTVDVFMGFYMDFLLNKFSGKGTRSPFWDLHYKLKNKMFLSQSVEVVWNNIYKIGNRHKKQNRPSSSIREFENKFFDTIRQEIEIIKPDLLIFFTGPDYEGRLRKKFEIIDKHRVIEDVSRDELAKLDLSIGIPAYRTYHPNKLRLDKKEHYLKSIVNDYLGL